MLVDWRATVTIQWHVSNVSGEPIRWKDKYSRATGCVGWARSKCGTYPQ